MTTNDALILRTEELRRSLDNARKAHDAALRQLALNVENARAAAALGALREDSFAHLAERMERVQVTLRDALLAQARLEELQGLQLHLAAN